MSDFEKFKEDLPRKEKFYSALKWKILNDKEYEHVLNVYNKFEMKTMKDCHEVFKMWYFIVSQCLKNLEIIS